jgi:hypothetical protein
MLVFGAPIQNEKSLRGRRFVEWRWLKTQGCRTAKSPQGHSSKFGIPHFAPRIFAQATSPQKIMARRRKNRTHLKGPATPSTSNTTNDGSPKSFIIKHGQVGSSLTQLVRDMRKVMEPNTASRLKVSPTLIRLGNYCHRLIGGERNAIGIN